MGADLEVTASSSFARRDFIKAGLAGALTAGGALASGQAFPGEHESQDNSRTRSRHMIIDAHNHPRWLGHDGARMIENMDAAGIEKTWFLSWEVPEGEEALEQHG